MGAQTVNALALWVGVLGLASAGASMWLLATGRAVHVWSRRHAQASFVVVGIPLVVLLIGIATELVQLQGEHPAMFIFVAFTMKFTVALVLGTASMIFGQRVLRASGG